jgi:3'-5' exonuclease
MSDQSVIVWDLETVPDLAAAARMLDLSNATDAEVREALGTGFPKYPLHKIACIGALIASRQPDGWRIDALGAPHIGQRTEAKLISDFMEKISELLPQLITFNGHSFDLPVLRYRAMVNRVSAAIFPSLYGRRAGSLRRIGFIRAVGEGEARRNQQDTRSHR